MRVRRDRFAYREAGFRGSGVRQAPAKCLKIRASFSHRRARQ